MMKMRHFYERGSATGDAVLGGDIVFERLSKTLI